MYLALDEATNDLMLDPEGGLIRVSEGRFTVQQVRSKLKTIRGEYFPLTSMGWVGLDDLTKNPDVFDIETRARQIILGTVGVTALDSLSLALGDRRNGTVSFVASTQYGIIYETLPWGVGE